MQGSRSRLHPGSIPASSRLRRILGRFRDRRCVVHRGYSLANHPRQSLAWTVECSCRTHHTLHHRLGSFVHGQCVMYFTGGDYLLHRRTARADRAVHFVVAGIYGPPSKNQGTSIPPVPRSGQHWRPAATSHHLHHVLLSGCLLTTRHHYQPHTKKGKIAR